MSKGELRKIRLAGFVSSSTVSRRGSHPLPNFTINHVPRQPPEEAQISLACQPIKLFRDDARIHFTTKEGTLPCIHSSCDTNATSIDDLCCRAQRDHVFRVTTLWGEGEGELSQPFDIDHASLSSRSNTTWEGGTTTRSRSEYRIP